MKRSSLARLGSVVALSALAMGACDSTAPGNVQLTVLLTDAPSDYLDSAWVDIGAVELIGGEGGPIVLSEDGTDGFVDLLELQGVATHALADLEIPAGTYSQLRLVVEAARVKLADGYTFNGSGEDSDDLTVPSGAQTGIKLNLSAAGDGGTEGGVEIAGGQTVLVVDFDVNQSFRIQGNPGTSGINSVSFQPTLRVVVDDLAGSISGSVSTAITDFVVEGLVVSAEPVEGTVLEPFQSMTATAVVHADGNYTVYFLVPADYQVSVDAGEGFTADVQDVTVGEGQAVTGIDFVIVEG